MNQFLEEQTRRISRELHDEAGQLLASVHLALDDVARDLPAPADARLHSMKTLLDRIKEELRRLSHDLRPTILDDLGLMAALGRGRASPRESGLRRRGVELDEDRRPAGEARCGTSRRFIAFTSVRGPACDRRAVWKSS